MLGTMDVRLLHRDLHPQLGPAAGHGVDRQVRTFAAHLFVGDDTGLAVDMEADPVLKEVDHENADVRILLNVSEAGKDAIAAILGVNQRPVVADLDEAGRAGPEGVVALSMDVGGGEEEHLLPCRELPHPRVEPVEHLLVVELVGAVGGAHALLEPVFAVTAWAVGAGGSDAAGAWYEDPLMLDRSVVSIDDQVGAFGPERGRPAAVLPGPEGARDHSRARCYDPLGTWLRPAALHRGRARDRLATRFFVPAPARVPVQVHMPVHVAQCLLQALMPWPGVAATSSSMESYRTRWERMPACARMPAPPRTTVGSPGGWPHRHATGRTVLRRGAARRSGYSSSRRRPPVEPTAKSASAALLHLP
ncbi:hypothetical protein GCM10022206_28480 [Streptomyces chiangmaiensis]